MIRILGGSVCLLVAAAMTVSAAPPARDYVVHLEALNGSGVEGTALLSLDGDQLTVSIAASGLEADMLHPQHIHGVDRGNSTCPPPDADENGDGIVDLAEGLPFYGPVLLPLTEFPTADGAGNIDYVNTFTIDPGAMNPLQQKTIVLHGMTVDGEYVASLPVACGQIVVDTPEVGRGSGPIVFVTSQELFYDSIVIVDPLPPNGPFQLLEMGPNGLQTEFGPGDPGYVGGRWKEDFDGDGIFHYFLCPLLGPGRAEP